MTKEETLFQSIAHDLVQVELSQMFGKPCIKSKGKAFACFFENEMVFKLDGNTHSEAISLLGAKLFDPSGKGRAMKEWVQVPPSHCKTWQRWAEEARKKVDR